MNITVTLTRTGKGSMNIQIDETDRNIVGQFLGHDVTGALRSDGQSDARAGSR